MTLSDPKLEKFAQALASNIAAGLPRGTAAQDAAEVAGYRGTSRAANARKRSRRADVKKRVAELFAAAQQRADSPLAATIEWATRKLVSIIAVDLGVDAITVSDQLMALKQLAELNGWKAPEKAEVSGVRIVFQVVTPNEGL